MDITVELSEKSLLAFDQKIKYLKNMGLNPESMYMLMVGPEDSKTIMKQIEAMFQSGFYEGYKQARKEFAGV